MARHRMRLMAFLGLVGALFAGPALASSKCVIIPSPSSEIWQLDYDPIRQDVAMGVFEFKVENRGETPCNIKTSVRLVRPGFGLRHEDVARVPDRVPYKLHNNDTQVELTPLTGSSPQGGGQPLHLDKHKPSGSVFVRFSVSTGMLTAGTYEQEVLLVLEDSHSVLERVIKLRLNVVPSAMMGLKGRFTRQGSTAVIDLGELVAGARPLGTKLYVQSTGRYQVTVSSANGGHLRQGSTDWTIPYSLIIGDTAMNLTGERVISNTSTRRRIDDYALSVNIGSTDGKRAGHYRDTITFTLAAI